MDNPEIRQPGYAGLREDLWQPFQDWCRERGLETVSHIHEQILMSSGYGEIRQLPAAYVLKAMNAGNIGPYVEMTGKMVIPEGTQSLVQRLSEKARQVRLCQRVEDCRLLPGSGVRLITQQESAEYDRVIFTAGLEQLCGMEAVPEELKEIFSHIRYQQYAVYLFWTSQLPPTDGYLIENLVPGRQGHVMKWVCHKGEKGGGVVAVYVSPRAEEPPRQRLERIREDLKKVGMSVDGLAAWRTWRHFPHVDGDLLRRGCYRVIQENQGRHGLYYGGEFLNGADVESCIAWSRELSEVYF